MSAAIAPNPNDPQAPLGMPARPWWIGYIRQLHLDIPLAVESGGTGKNTPLDASDIAETSTLKILTADERTKLTGIAEGANNYTHPATHPQSMIDGLATALAACRPKHTYVGVTTASTSIAAERGNTYGINAYYCTLTLPSVATAGYVDGDEICVIVGVTAARELTITSPSLILRGTGLQSVNTPFNITGYGTWISFVKYSNVWAMSYPEYDLANKAPLLSPALTGTPTAPTPAAGTNTTQLATTAFVQAKAAGALLTEGTPSGPTATGTKGMARFDANYIYVCTATNTWVRFPKDGSWT